MLDLAYNRDTCLHRSTTSVSPRNCSTTRNCPRKFPHSSAAKPVRFLRWVTPRQTCRPSPADKRESTHFFRVPPPTKRTGLAGAVFDRYPLLAVAGGLSAQQAAFMAGYICHLQADQLWISNDLPAIFRPRMPMGGSTRLFRHNVLRTYIDERIIQDLPDETGDLPAARPADMAGCPLPATNHCAAGVTCWPTSCSRRATAAPPKSSQSACTCRWKTCWR